MIEKKLNMLPTEQKNFLLQEKAKVGAGIALITILLSIGGFEGYMYQLDKQTMELETKKAEVTQLSGQIKALHEQNDSRAYLLSILQNQEFPIHDFLTTLSTQIPKNLWLYSVSGDDYTAVVDVKPTDGTVQPNGEAGQAGQVPQTDTTQTTSTPQPNGQTQDPNAQANQQDPNTQPQLDANGQPIVNQAQAGQQKVEKAKDENPKAHKTLIIRGAGTSPTEIGQFVQILNSKNYVEKATLSSVEEYLANNQVYQAFEIRVEGR